MSTPARAIIRIIARGETATRINYSRRMYAIMRRYTPQAVEVSPNLCFAELTGLRTFFKKSYTELSEAILRDLKKEIGASFSLRIATPFEYDTALVTQKSTKKKKSISTYTEINSLFKGASFIPAAQRKEIFTRSATKRIRLSVPFLGKVK